jgi:VWFA-related protein
MSTRYRATVDDVRFRRGRDRRARLAALCATLLAALPLVMLSAQQGQPPAAEPPPVTFYTEVNFIEVDASVTDSAGNPVPNLKVDDFELYEDGKKQQIQSFTAVNLPIVKADRPLYSRHAIEPDVRTNEGGEGRIYMIVLDDIHVEPARALRVRTALHQFVDRNFGTNDLAAVVRIRNSRDSQDFTNNPRLLLRAIDRFTGNIPRERASQAVAATADPTTGTTLPTAVVTGAAQPTPANLETVLLPGVGGSTSPDNEVAKEARDVSSRIRELSEFLAGVRGRRKSLLLVSEGSPFDTFTATGQAATIGSIVVEDIRKAVAAATRGNVTIYAIDPRHLMPVDTNALSAAELQTTTDLRLSQDNLREIAYETGGFASMNMNNLDRAFERIVNENSAYYVLGFSSSNERRDGSYRKLEVRVRRPGLQVRSRNGYTAASGREPATAAAPKPSASLPGVASALASPLPTSGLPLRVFAAPYRGSSHNATVVLAIEIDGSKLDFMERNGLFAEQVEVAHSASDALGKARPATRHRMELNLKPASYAKATKGGVRILSQMELPPGRYQLRVAAGNGIGRSGAVFYDLEIPDFAKEDFTMSGLALMSSNSGDALTLVPKPLPIAFGGPIITSRVFDANSTVGVFGEVYENANKGRTHTVDIKTELRTDTGTVVRTSSDQRSSTELQSSSGGYGFTAVLPLKGLSPGIYVLHAEARSNIGARLTTSRDVQISIR